MFILFRCSFQTVVQAPISKVDTHLKLVHPSRFFSAVPFLRSAAPSLPRPPNRGVPAACPTTAATSATDHRRWAPTSPPRPADGVDVVPPVVLMEGDWRGVEGDWSVFHVPFCNMRFEKAEEKGIQAAWWHLACNILGTSGMPILPHDMTSDIVTLLSFSFQDLWSHVLSRSEIASLCRRK